MRFKATNGRVRLSDEEAWQLARIGESLSGMPAQEYLKRMIAESGLYADAVSKKDAIGVFQIEADTAERWGYDAEDMYDPRKAVIVSALTDTWHWNQPQVGRQPKLAHRAYNNGLDADLSQREWLREMDGKKESRDYYGAIQRAGKSDDFNRILDKFDTEGVARANVFDSDTQMRSGPVRYRSGREASFFPGTPFETRGLSEQFVDQQILSWRQTRPADTTTRQAKAGSRGFMEQGRVNQEDFDLRTFGEAAGVSFGQREGQADAAPTPTAQIAENTQGIRRMPLGPGSADPFASDSFADDVTTGTRGVVDPAAELGSDDPSLLDRIRQNPVGNFLTTQATPEESQRLIDRFVTPQQQALIRAGVSAITDFVTPVSPEESARIIDAARQVLTPVSPERSRELLTAESLGRNTVRGARAVNDFAEGIIQPIAETIVGAPAAVADAVEPVIDFGQRFGASAANELRSPGSPTPSIGGQVQPQANQAVTDRLRRAQENAVDVTDQIVPASAGSAANAATTATPSVGVNNPATNAPGTLGEAANAPIQPVGPGGEPLVTQPATTAATTAATNTPVSVPATPSLTNDELYNQFIQQVNALTGAIPSSNRTNGPASYPLPSPESRYYNLPRSIGVPVPATVVQDNAQRNTSPDPVSALTQPILGSVDVGREGIERFFTGEQPVILGEVVPRGDPIARQQRRRRRRTRQDGLTNNAATNFVRSQLSSSRENSLRKNLDTYAEIWNRANRSATASITMAAAAQGRPPEEVADLIREAKPYAMLQAVSNQVSLVDLIEDMWDITPSSTGGGDAV